VETPRIALLAPVPASLITGNHPDVEVVEVREQSDAVAACTGATIVIADWSGNVIVDRDVVAALDERCRLIQVPASGLDSVDVDAIREAGIPLASCWGTNADTVAEWCVWAALDALRGLSSAQASLRAGSWEQTATKPRLGLAGRRVGVVGLGAVGQAVARDFTGLGCETSYWSRTRRDADMEEDLGVSWREVDELLATSDVLVLAQSLTKETRGWLDADRIDQLPEGAVVVNAARGAVWDTAAVAAAVASGRLHAAATDVFEREPAPPDDPAVLETGITVTPHIAGVSVDAVTALITRVLANVDAVLDGGEIQGLVDVS
jgi:D-3-phosphoglycerate dehydrogenase